jgi:8-oxo-dGTP pyrophosphatase MutT (NUDIX family)
VADVVRAAGGVVWRVEGHELQIVLIHRPGFDDWSLPKGKREARDVDDEHTALREVLEETGLRCSLGRELPSVAYLDRKGRDKTVRYWEMRPVADEGFHANDEVDDVRWVDVPTAAAMLSYVTDRHVLEAFALFAGQQPRAAGQ